jgi:hypothetical protein
MPTGTTERIRCPQCELLQTVLCRRCQAKLKFAVVQAPDPVADTLAAHPVAIAAKMLGMSERTLYRRKAAKIGRDRRLIPQKV